jgi:hypothetical protein
MFSVTTRLKETKHVDAQLVERRSKSAFQKQSDEIIVTEHKAQPSTTTLLPSSFL